MRNAGKPLRKVIREQITINQGMAKMTKAQIFQRYPGPRRKHSGSGRDKNVKEGLV